MAYLGILLQSEINQNPALRRWVLSQMDKRIHLHLDIGTEAVINAHSAVASLTVPGGQEFHFPHFFLKFLSIFLILPQTVLIFLLILALQVGASPTREGPGYATE